MKGINQKTLDRFWKKVNKDGDCWIWTASKSSSGYGWFWVSGSGPKLAHQISFGRKPKAGLVIAHKCNTPECVRPSHLVEKSISQIKGSIPANKRFWKFVRKNKDECWDWIGGKTSAGYGCFGVVSDSGKWKMWQAHRYSHLLHHGYESKIHICHHCDNRLCVNPDHLFEGTDKDNVWDCIKKGRFKPGGKMWTP